ncbi:flavin reductase family protein [Novosphingobium sp. 1949]|uniref:Flavin reductase family protein n=1 Tax=Novosphingobium organovorum TaxID=2930092 RepID=A0ABT0BBK2_9SPHN|nr:flavin reductase family protein [Novosphingobium organovorum]MCJ2182440.1 flavin reductase family protein [Novosphingobium organovorum]
MEFDFSQLSPPDRYKLMGSSVCPRPIAWVTTLNEDGSVNTAPYSFFNVMSAEPPLLALGMMRKPDMDFKDTPANIRRTGEFVVNLVNEENAEAMNFTCIDSPPGFDELAAAGLETAPSSAVAPPRIASAPVSMECRTFETVETTHSTIVLGQILRFHIGDRFVNPDNLHVDALPMGLVARMHGAGWYTRATDLFQMTRPVFAQWQADQEQAEQASAQD